MPKFITSVCILGLLSSFAGTNGSQALGRADRLGARLIWPATRGVDSSGQDEPRRKSAKEGSSRDDTLKLNSTLVLVPAVVLDPNGKFLTDLDKGDFNLNEDGKRQQISTFTTVKQPFTAVLILDTSNTAEDRLNAIKNTATDFVGALGPEDRLMVISFDNEVRKLTEFTTDKSELTSAIKAVASGYGKLLYEAVATALEQLKDAEGRRALILLSDGVDLKSIHISAADNFQSADDLGVVAYPIKFSTRWWIESAEKRNRIEHPESNSPLGADIRIPLPPVIIGPDSGSTGSPGGGRPKIEISTGTGLGLPNREKIDPITEALDKLYGEADTYMQTLATRTGGKVFDSGSISDVQTAFRDITTELHNQYLIGYYPAVQRTDGKFHKIQLQVNRKGVQVRARSGYQAQKPQ